MANWSWSAKVRLFPLCRIRYPQILRTPPGVTQSACERHYLPAVTNDRIEGNRKQTHQSSPIWLRRAAQLKQNKHNKIYVIDYILNLFHFGATQRPRSVIHTRNPKCGTVADLKQRASEIFSNCVTPYLEKSQKSDTRILACKPFPEIRKPVLWLNTSRSPFAFRVSAPVSTWSLRDETERVFSTCPRCCS